MLYRLCLITILAIIPVRLAAQNSLDLGGSVSFDGDKEFFQTFNLEFNRTKAIPESSNGNFLTYEPSCSDLCIFYVQPSFDIDLGPGVSTSANNILNQVKAGWYLFPDSDSVSSRYIRPEVSFNQNSDRTFDELLYFAQLDINLDLFKRSKEKIKQTKPATDSTKAKYSSYRPRERSMYITGTGQFGNRGTSTNTRSLNRYSRAGFSARSSWSFRKWDGKNKTSFEYLSIDLSGNFFWLIDEVDQLNSNPTTGYFKVSLATEIKGLELGDNQKIKINGAYEYGDNNAVFNLVNAVTIGFSFSY